MGEKAKKIILILTFLFVLVMPKISHAGNMCLDANGFYCAHFFNLDTEWLVMSHTDTFTDVKRILLVKLENGSNRLWKKYGKKGIWGGKRIVLLISCSSDKKEEFENLVFWPKDVFESSLGKKLQILGAIVAIESGAFGGPPSMRKSKTPDKAKKELENMRIEVISRFDSKTAKTTKWSIRSRIGGNKIMQITSSIPNDILQKIISGHHRRFALKGNFLSAAKTAIFDLRQTKSAITKLLSVCPDIKN